MILRRLSLRARLTLGTGALAFVVLTVALLFVRLQITDMLAANDASLARSDLSSFESDLRTQDAVDNPDTGVLVSVRSPTGTVPIDTLPHELKEWVRGRPGSVGVHVVQDHGVPFTVVSDIVTTDKGTWDLWAARSGEAAQRTLQSLDLVLTVGGIALLAAFVLASWLLARASLRPVERMRQRAAALGAEPGDGSLPVGPVRDELSQLAQTLNEFVERIRESGQREKQVVSDAAHELRTPLAALRMQLELAHRDAGDAAALERELASAEVSARRLSSLATNLLELARAEQGDQRSESSGDRLLDELGAAVDRARLLSVATGITVTFDAEEPDGSRYGIDAEAFGRIADNLLANAIAALGDRGEVQARLDADEEGIRLTVTDDGPGVPDAFLPRAFDRFSRPDDSRSTERGGSGLGLALVRTSARAAGGDAEIRNRHPGLEVVVTIPRL